MFVITNPKAPASSKQIEYLFDLFEQKMNFTKEYEIVNWLLRKRYRRSDNIGIISLSDLTKEQASDLIEYLKEY